MEAHFVHYLLRTMRSTAKLGPENRTYQRRMYDDMMDQAIADRVAETGQFGIGEMLYRQLAPAYEAAQNAKEGDQ